MKMKKMIYLAFVLLFLSANSMKAQVVISTLDTESDKLKPHPGAILDLGKVPNTNLGLLLPQVTLTDAKEWAPVVGTKADEVDGMLVYNESTTTENGLNGKGAYVWYDNSWNKLGLFDASDNNIVKDYDGNTYHYACFGVAGCWMQENLKTTKYADGTSIPYKNGSDNSSNDPDLPEYDYPNRNEQSTAYGLLYTWAAASGRTGVSDDEGNNPNQPSVQGVCPDGWHLPSDWEWSQLEEVIDKDATNKYASSPANTATVDYYTTRNADDRGFSGAKMRSVNRVTGGEFDTQGTSNFIDNNGFEVYLADYLQRDGTVRVFGQNADFWTSSNLDESMAWIRYTAYWMNGWGRGMGGRPILLSIRCKKN